MAALSVDDYPIVTVDKIRYSDTDKQGHVNNAVFSMFLETGRVELFYRPDEPLTSANAEFVVASIKLELKGEIHWPGEVKTGLGVKRIGNSSIHLGQALFYKGKCVAQAETVIVQIDQETRKSMPLSSKTRKRLQELSL